MPEDFDSLFGIIAADATALRVLHADAAGTAGTTAGMTDATTAGITDVTTAEMTGVTTAGPGDDIDRSCFGGSFIRINPYIFENHFKLHT